MKFDKKYNNLLGGFTVLLILCYSFLFYKNNIQLTPTSLDEQHWIESPGLVTVTHRENNIPMLSIFRLSDGIEEKFIGNWNYNYFYQDELAIFGTKIEKPSEQLLYILSTRGGNLINVSKLSGEIKSISRNPRGTYLLVSGVTSTSSTQQLYTCVAERKDTLTPCIDIQKDALKKVTKNENSLFRAFWDLKNDRRIVIKEIGEENRTFFFDPWDTTANLVTSTEQIQTVDEGPFKKIEETRKDNSFKRYGSITVFRNYHKNKGNLYVYIPRSNPIILVSSRHFLFQKGDSFYILNTEKQTIGKFTSAPKNIEKISTLYSEYPIVEKQ